MELEFDVHVDANALYDYMLRHTFTKAAGILGSTAGALGIVAGMNFVCIQNQAFACGNRAVHIFPFLKLLRLLLGNLHALFGHLIMKRLLKNGKQRLFLRTQP